MARRRKGRSERPGGGLSARPPENNRRPRARTGLRGWVLGESHVPEREAIGSSGLVCERPLATSGCRDEPIGQGLEDCPGRGGEEVTGPGRWAGLGRAGPSWAELGRAERRHSPRGNRSPSPSCGRRRRRRRRHALGLRAAEECVPGRGAQVHRTLQQVLPVPAVHKAVSGLWYGVGGGAAGRGGPRGAGGSE